MVGVAAERIAKKNNKVMERKVIGEYIGEVGFSVYVSHI